MKLSEIIKGIDSVSLKRDGEFEYLKLISVKTESEALTFIEDEKYLGYINESISCIVCNKKLYDKIPERIGVVISENPKIDFFKIHNKLIKEEMKTNDRHETVIGDMCSISEKAIISNYNVKIGNNVVIEENVIIRDNVEIGDNSIIRAGSIIGGEGFEFIKIGQESILQVVHGGGVKIGKYVEIQYNAHVDKAVFQGDCTAINNHTKVDNNTHIGHGVKIGKRCLIASSVSVSGSTIIGDDCWIGAGAIVSNNLTIGKDSRINIGSVVTKDVKEEESVSGNFAINHSKFLEFIKTIR